jgi:excisionase family DNA binding protein
MFKKIMSFLKEKKEPQANVLYITASMQGNLTFGDPVDLRINGIFQGSLNTKGKLFIGESAVVKATIKGDAITVVGKVLGDIISNTELTLLAPSIVTGNIKTPSLSIEKGSILQGRCEMNPEESIKQKKQILMTPSEVAEYLEVDIEKVREWARSGKVPVIQDGGEEFKFDRTEVDKWILEQPQS